MTIEIVNWDKLYENNRTRKMVHTAWVPIPNKHDGYGYTDLVSHEDGAAHFGAWCALLQVASKCAKRGTLVRSNGDPHDCRSLSLITRLPEELWEAVLPRLANIGWIRIIANAQDGAPSVPPNCTLVRETDEEQNRTEQKEQKGNTLSGSCDPDSVEALLSQQSEEKEPIPYSQIIKLLNECSGSRYSPSSRPTRGLIKARWNEGFRPNDFEAVIRSKCAQWKRDPKMVSYLRPLTLFGTKFEGYLQVAGSIAVPCECCGLLGGKHKYDCPHSETAKRERRTEGEGKS